MTAWLFLAGAIGFEIIGTFCLKLSNGMAVRLWGVIAILCYGVCFTLLAPAMKSLPVGIVYGVWSGVGIAAAALIGLVAFGERLDALQLLFMAFIFIGVVGLQLSSRA